MAQHRGDDLDDDFVPDDTVALSEDDAGGDAVLDSDDIVHLLSDGEPDVAVPAAATPPAAAPCCPATSAQPR